MSYPGLTDFFIGGCKYINISGCSMRLIKITNGFIQEVHYILKRKNI